MGGQEIIGNDGEARQGWRHFRCNVCELAYSNEDLGYLGNDYLVQQGRYQMVDIEVCVECIEYIGGDYE